jgi:hypothetical protein
MNQIVETNPTQVPLGTHPLHFQKQWKLMRADANIYQDVLHKGSGTVLDLRMNKGTGIVTAFDEVPPAFAKTQLELKGNVPPTLEDAGMRDALNPYDVNLDDEYRDALDNYLIPYFRADMAKSDGGELAHLEGVITMRCCWPIEGSRLAELNPDPHFIKTDVRLYLFDEGVRDGTHPSASRSTLLVMWAPDSPHLPANPDGSIVGNP